VREATDEAGHRLERAVALRRTTDRSWPKISVAVGLSSIGSFTTSLTRAYSIPPPTGSGSGTPPAAVHALVPTTLPAVGRTRIGRLKKTSQAA
jgi:hypothetical protein